VASANRIFGEVFEHLRRMENFSVECGAQLILGAKKLCCVMYCLAE